MPNLNELVTFWHLIVMKQQKHRNKHLLGNMHYVLGNNMSVCYHVFTPTAVPSSQRWEFTLFDRLDEVWHKVRLETGIIS